MRNKDRDDDTNIENEKVKPSTEIIEGVSIYLKIT